MRKWVSAALAPMLFGLVLLPVAAHAQIGIGKGVKGGINRADITGDDAGSTDARNGFAAGAFLRLGLTVLSVQPEVLYSQKGATGKDVEDGEPIDIEVKLAYLEIPVLVRLSLGGVPGLKPSLFAGPAFGILLSAKSRASFGGNAVEVDVKDEIKNMDMGAVVGLGLDIANITVDVRYTVGLSSIDDTGSDEQLKNKVISVMGGISF